MKNMLINLFMDLVKIDSVTTNEEKFSRYLLKSLNNLGVKSVLDKYRNIYGYLKGTGKPLFLSAHMDTVEPGKNIQPQVRGNYIVSDGTTILGADNKATIACILNLFSPKVWAKLICLRVLRKLILFTSFNINNC